MNEDLIAFWRARLDETQAAAEAAQGRNPAPWTWKAVGARDYLQEIRDARDSFVAEFAGGADVRPDIAIHVTLHDPASVLRDIAADREILAAHEAAGRASREVYADQVAAEVLGKVVKIRAARFSVHPDYRKEWAS